MARSSRRVIYAPDICRDACLLFSYTSQNPRSFCLRHHGPSGSIEIRPSQCASYVDTAWIQARVAWQTVAEGVPFEQASYWRERLREYAESMVQNPADRPSFDPKHFPGAARGIAAPSGGLLPPASAGTPLFPFVDRHLIPAHKAAKAQDMQRMDTSPRSEDYVTWALVCAWRRCKGWWAPLVRLAADQATGLDPRLFNTPEPDWEAWRRVSSPRAYEQLSRKRMAASVDPLLAMRAADARPVEGESEIDIAFISDAYVVFVEAKLGSDISLSTTYDPTRNQLVRVIDCALEEASGRPAAVWMFVKDIAPSRMYMTLVHDYRRDPGQLHRLLPHRTREEVESISRHLAVITWDSLLGALNLQATDLALRAVLDEVRGRL